MAGQRVTQVPGPPRSGSGACHERGQPSGESGAPDRRRRAWCFLTSPMAGWPTGTSRFRS